MLPFPECLSQLLSWILKKKSPTSDQSSIAGLLVGQLDSFLPVFLSRSQNRGGFCAFPSFFEFSPKALLVKAHAFHYRLVWVCASAATYIRTCFLAPGARNKLKCGFLLDNAGTKVAYWRRGHINRIFLCITWSLMKLIPLTLHFTLFNVPWIHIHYHSHACI